VPPRQLLYSQGPCAVLSFNLCRAMARPAVDTHPLEDDDLADLGGVVKYGRTGTIEEKNADSLRIYASAASTF